MKPFRFSLEALGVVREQKEKAAQHRFVAALHEAAQAAELLRQGDLRLHSCWRELRQCLHRGIAATELLRLRQYAASLEEDHRELENKCRAARAAADRAGSEMRLAMRDREIIDQLRARKRRVYQAGILREQQKVLDELSVGLPGARVSLVTR